MIKDLKALAEEKGFRLEIVSVENAKSMQKEIEKFQSETELDGLQKPSAP